MSFFLRRFLSTASHIPKPTMTRTPRTTSGFIIGLYYNHNMVNDQFPNLNNGEQPGTVVDKTGEVFPSPGSADSGVGGAIGQGSQQPPGNIAGKPERRSRLWVKLLVAIIGISAVLGVTVFARSFLQQRAIANLEKNGSAEYQQYAGSIQEINKQWSRSFPDWQ